MTHSRGFRCKTRHAFARGFRKHGIIGLTAYNRVYKLGQYVDIKVNGAYHKGMPHHFYHGRTGTVFNVGPRALGVQVHKRVKGRILLKRIYVRLEHLSPSKCRDDHIARVKANELARKHAKENNLPVPCLKRINPGPRPSHDVDISNAIEVTPIKYDGIF